MEVRFQSDKMIRKKNMGRYKKRRKKDKEERRKINNKKKKE